MLFYKWLFEKCVVNIQFVGNIMFTDEAGFTRDGIVTSHNTHVWVDNNPHTTVTSRHQHRFSINVWVNILGDQFPRPVVLPNRLTFAVYSRLFGEWFTSTLGTYTFFSMTTRVVHARWAPPHFLRIVAQYLNQTFSKQWIGRGGPVNWITWSLSLIF
jgi:hypothetical protein